MTKVVISFLFQSNTIVLGVINRSTRIVFVFDLVNSFKNGLKGCSTLQNGPLRDIRVCLSFNVDVYSDS